jgi:uncharacterized protein (DUF779 family)
MSKISPNRNLISAAPDLLEALKKAYGELHFLTKDERCDHAVNICWCECHRILDDAKAAITKAEGKEGA